MNTFSDISPDMVANNLVPNDPTHPGEFLREELECRKMTQTRLANDLGIKVSLLNELINGKRDITIEYALMLEAALGIDADFWINAQNYYSKAKAQRNAGFMARIANIRKIAAMMLLSSCGH